MILADSNVWIDHLHTADPIMRKLLGRRQIAMHPFVAGELALGPLPDRRRMLADLDLIPLVPVALNSEVRRMIENHGFHNRGIGWTDAHLIAAALIDPSIQLWSRDKALRRIAESLNLHVAWN